MKKLILIIIGCIICLMGAYAQENDFTWAKYEAICFKYGVDPNWGHYKYLCENPQGYGDEDNSELERLIKESKTDQIY